MEYDKEHVNDLYEDMDRLNSLYEELMLEHEDVLEMFPDYANDRIIIKINQGRWIKMTNLENKIIIAEDRIKELQLLIEHWRKQNETNTKSN